jgi:hypothetical protein
MSTDETTANPKANTGPDPDSAATPDNSEPGEFRCPDCRCRVTRSPTDPALEYGHSQGTDRRSLDGGRCPRRPAAVDSGRAGGDSEPFEGRDERGRFAGGGA